MGLSNAGIAIVVSSFLRLAVRRDLLPGQIDNARRDGPIRSKLEADRGLTRHGAPIRRAGNSRRGHESSVGTAPLYDDPTAGPEW
jgi:hypothetical protein